MKFFMGIVKFLFQLSDMKGQKYNLILFIVVLSVHCIRYCVSIEKKKHLIN